MLYTPSFDQKKMVLLLTTSLCLAILIFSPASALAETSPREGIEQAESEKNLMDPAQNEMPVSDESTLIHRAFPHIVETKSGWVSARISDSISKKLSHAVMAGSFSENAKKNAAELAARLKEKWEPYVCEVLCGKEKWFAVMIGAYNTLEKASQTAAEFKEREGMVAVAVTISEKLAFIILAEAFPNKEEDSREKLDALMARLKSYGHDWEIFQASDTKGQEWSVVLTKEKYDNLEKALRQASRLRKKEKRAEVTYKSDDPHATIRGPQLVRSIQEILDTFPVEDGE